MGDPVGRRPGVEKRTRSISDSDKDSTVVNLHSMSMATCQAQVVSPSLILKYKKYGITRTRPLY